MYCTCEVAGVRSSLVARQQKKTETKLNQSLNLHDISSTSSRVITYLLQ